MYKFDDILRRSGPSSRDTVDKLRGVHLAEVTDNKDTPPQNPGYHVRVKLLHLPTEENTYWARVLTPMAGNDRGVYFLPEVGAPLAQAALRFLDGS